MFQLLSMLFQMSESILAQKPLLIRDSFSFEGRHYNINATLAIGEGPDPVGSITNYNLQNLLSIITQNILLAVSTREPLVLNFETSQGFLILTIAVIQL